ncbi:hypothetical protein [Nitrosomonas nitrosa]|uniref:hypothetical protein n=1 Tax=Nitrosomonas nitrosa TaxID=52442 RepID=UPI0023F623A6|nr:hypothetical protein [Nitrosomonas nitrosa]MCO6433194.1 hypothetical protein [Nitrosomonas nitrosa]
MISLTEMTRCTVPFAAACFLALSAAAGASSDNHHTPLPTYQYPNIYNNYLQPVVTAIDYHTRMLYLINYENDKLITVDPTSIAGWPGNIPLQHTVVLPEGNKIFVTSDRGGPHFLDRFLRSYFPTYQPAPCSLTDS